MNTSTDEQAWAAAVNTETKRYPENERGGFVICGANWGGEPPNPATYVPDEPSFFSDPKVSDYPYRNKLLSWFDLLGHPLSRDVAGPFERSIVQTNWLSGAHYQSRRVDGDLLSYCREPQMVEDVVRRFRLLQPRLILFASATVFNAFVCVSESFGDTLGAPVGSVETAWCRPPTSGSRSARAMLARFGKCNVMGLPHPTGQAAVANASILSFRPLLSPIISDFRARLVSHQ